MKKCKNCGAIIGNEDVFCAECGVKLSEENIIVVKTCAKCGAILNDEDAFCSECGTKALVEVDNAVIEKSEDVKNGLSPKETSKPLPVAETTKSLKDNNSEECVHKENEQKEAHAVEESLRNPQAEGAPKSKKLIYMLGVFVPICLICIVAGFWFLTRSNSSVDEHNWQGTYSYNTEDEGFSEFYTIQLEKKGDNEYEGTYSYEFRRGGYTYKARGTSNDNTLYITLYNGKGCKMSQGIPVDTAPCDTSFVIRFEEGQYITTLDGQDVVLQYSPEYNLSGMDDSSTEKNDDEVFDRDETGLVVQLLSVVDSLDLEDMLDEEKAVLCELEPGYYCYEREDGENYIIGYGHEGYSLPKKYGKLVTLRADEGHGFVALCNDDGTDILFKEKPSEDSKTIDIYNARTDDGIPDEANCLGVVGEWYKIDYYGTVGYVKRKLTHWDICSFDAAFVR